MAVNLVRKSKDEEEEEKRKQLLAQMQENSQARKNAEIQAVKNSNVKFNNPYVGGGTYLAGKYVAGLGEGTTNIVSAPMQTLALGFQQGSKQASKEQTTWDKIKNFGKNTIKSFAYSDPTMITRLMYDTTVGRDEFIQNANEVTTQIQQNASQADSTWKKATAYLGGYGSFIQKQYLNSGLNQLQTGAQSVGQVLGSEKSQQASQALLQADDKLHEPIDKLNEELSKSEGSQNKVIRRLGNASYTIGNMTPSILISALSGGAGASDATREALSLTSMGISAKGGSTREGLKQGLDLSTAERIGVSKGMVEVGTEKMWNGLSFLKSPDSKVGSAIRTWIGKQVEDRIKSQFGKTVLTKWIPDLAGETLEEFVSGIYDNWLDRATVDPNRGSFFKEQSLDTLIDTTLSTLLMNAPSYVLETKAIHDRNKKGNQTNVNTEESNGYKQNLQEMVNNLDIPNEMKAELQQTIDSNETITGEEYNNTKERIKSLVKQNTQQQIDSLSNNLNNQYIDINNRLSELDNIKAENFKDPESRRFYAQQINKEFGDTTLDSILAGYPENRNGNRTVKQYKEIAKAYGKQMAENGLTFDEVRANTVGAWQYYEPNKNITRYDNQQKKNASFERLNSQVWSEEVYNSYKDTMRTQLQQQQEALSTQMNDELARLQDEENILIDTIDNLKPRIEAVKSSLVQSAEQYGYKGKQISEIQDLMKRRGINAYFDETQFNNDSEGAFYNPKTNEIVFNPNASQDQVIQELAVHEWYHDLKAKGQGEEIQQSVIDFLKNNKDYQDLRKSLENAYAKLTDPNTGEYLYDIESKEFSDMIDEEATAKTLQRVLGNETEIQRLINYKPSLARRIYDAVVDLLNKFTGGRIEKLYWQDVRNKFEAAFNENGISTNEGTTRYSVKENRQYLEKQFEELTGDSILKADAKLAGREVRNRQRQAGNLEGEMEALPYNEEAMDLYNKIKSSVKSSNYLYHSTPADRLQSIIENGLTIGNKQNQEGVSSTNKLYLSASEELANSFTPDDSITFRINPNAKLENLDSDLLGGEGAYTITNNIPPEMLQVKENGKWVRLDKSELAKTANSQTTTTDNQGRTLTKEQQEYFKDVAPELRDNKNNLKTYYTGTNADFTIFDKNKIDIANLGRGFYFTDNKQIAESYAQRRTSERGGNPRIVEAYIKSLKPFDMENVTKEQAIDYLTYDFMNAKYVNRTLEQARNEALEFVKEYENDMINDDAIDYSDLISTSDDNFQQWIKKEGYDSLLVPGKDKRTGLEGTAVVVFEPNQIKNVDNKTPTANSDIRYSVNTDNQGRELSEEQQEYFKDSKVRDSEGNLITLYHGTDSEVTTFDTNKPTYARYGSGAYLTDGIGIASEFADIRAESNNGKARIIEGYANIDKMFDNTTGLRENTPERQKLFELLKERGLSDRQLSNIESAEIDYPFQLMERYLVKDEVTKDPWIKADTVNELLREAGYNGIKGYYGDGSYEYIAFNSNQIKNVDNTKPTTNSDIRYSEDTNFDDWANNNLPSLGEGKTTLGDLRTEQRLPVNQPETTQLPTTNVQATTESLEIPNEQTSLPLGEQVNPSERKQRKAYKSIIESPVMSEEAKKVARKFIGADTYTPDSNLKQLERADNIISRLGTEKALNQLESNAMEGRTIKAEDIATGDRLIEYYSKIGDSENLQRAIRATAMAGTQAGRSVQAFALLKHQTPQGMAVWIQNSVDKLNSQTKNGQFDFTTEMQEKILNSTEDNLQENVDEVMKELGQQVPQSLLGKLDTWRYFSMLANPKTHIRNIVGNFAMGLTQQVKSKVAGTIEQVTGQDRTHTSLFEKRSRANIDFAKNDLKNVSAQLGIGESKYSNPKNQIQQNQRVFKSDALEKSLGRMFKMNDNLLEAEDNFGLKNAYVRNLSDYMTANKLNPKTITNEQLQQARKVAVEEALRATFHQESSLASMLNQIENKNLASRILMGGLVPFKKTPINVAKSGFEYSPAGLAKAIVYDSVQLRKGNINVNEYIDNISKGLTGTGIALVGYALAEAGILKAGGDDDKDEKYRQAMGEQPYSIMINGKSYSLDWLAPTGIPLFVGAELNKLMHDKTEKDGETQNDVLKAMGRIADATTSLLNPMSEMSMISGLTSTIQSFSSDPGQALMNLVVSPVKSYVGQAVPTALGQVARTTDKYERDTSSTETGLLPKAIDQTKNQIMNKIPGLRQMLPTKKDVWGEEVETQDYFHNAVLPYTEKEIKTNAVDKELNDLFERTGESIYPSTSLSKTVTYEGSKTRLTNQDYNDFKTNYGKISYKLLEDLTKSKEYKGMSDEQKVKAIKDVYTYVNNLNKTEYAQKKGIDFKTPTDVQQVRAVKAYGGKESDYFKYKGITDGLSKDSEKMVALRDSNLSAKSKRAVYSATLGKDDTFFQSTDINVNEYLGYKTANIQGVKDSNGKTISGSKKAAQLDYINNNISGYENRLLLMGKDYKLSRSQQQDLAEYIYTLDNADDLFAMYDKNFTVRDGTVYYK